MKILITVYTNNDTNSNKTIRALKINNLPFHTCDVTKDKAALDRLSNRGLRTLPVVNVKTQYTDTTWCGHSRFEIEKLAQMYHKLADKPAPNRYDHLKK